MINNLEQKPPMPKSPTNLVVILVALVLIVASLLVYKNYMENKNSRGLSMELPAESNNQLPAISKPSSTASVNLAVLQGEVKNTAIVQISSEMPTELVDGVEFVIHFDPDLVEEVTVKPSKIFSSVVRNTADTQKGLIDLALVRLPNEAVTVDAAATLATITYTPKQAGEIMFSFDPEATVVAGNQGDNLLKSIKDLTVTN
ncbi:MAG: cohesin domain-containing protein [bacterium]|nr:cohesin domain-containing protein [bacterium]